MKKLALLLGALSLVSSVAYAKEVVPAVEEVVVVEEAAPVVAAPALTVTNVGQYVEVDNTSSGENIGEAVHFAQVVGLAYDDWTFGIMARKAWSMDTDDGIHGAGHRIDLDVWKQVNDNLALGARWRQEEEYDRYYLRTKYNYGMFSGNIDVAYQSNNSSSDHEDAYYVEAIPVAVTVGPVTLGYYFEADTWAVNTKEFALDKYGDVVSTAGYEHNYRQQLRVSAPVYTGEKLSLGLEYRWQFDTDTEYDYKVRGEGWDEVDTNHIVVLSASYDVTENFNVNGYYQYEMRDYDRKGDNLPAKADNYYGEFCIGWNYTF